jgi:hypothetical protein
VTSVGAKPKPMRAPMTTNAPRHTPRNSFGNRTAMAVAR